MKKYGVFVDHSEAGNRGYQKTKHLLIQHQEAQRRQAQEKYAANPTICPTCGSSLPYEKRYNKFCNSSCAASYNNRGVVRNSEGIGLSQTGPRSKIARYCSCGNIRKRTNRYCDECIEKRIFNKHPSLADAKDDRSRKRILLEQRGHRCESCGLAEWRSKPIPLELDHVDGNTDNNAEENLRVICPNCHAQTETYKGANVGGESSRQKMRRQRYADGKTY